MARRSSSSNPPRPLPKKGSYLVDPHIMSIPPGVVPSIMHPGGPPLLAKRNIPTVPIPLPKKKK